MDGEDGADSVSAGRYENNWRSSSEEVQTRER